MEFFRDTDIDFMKYRRFWIAVSLVLLVVGIFTIFVHGKLNVGIDFAGGTQLTLRFKERPRIDELRRVVAAAGIPEAQIQRFGGDEDNEVMIKTPNPEGAEEGSRDLVVRALGDVYNRDSGGRFDLNQNGAEALAGLLLSLDPDQVVASDPEAAGAHYRQLAEAIIDQRQEDGLLESWEEVAAVPGVSPEVVSALQQGAFLGSFAIVAAESVGPQVGAELRKKGFLAVIFSLLGMLIYIWIRFELRFGVGALMATLHDVLITLGLFAWANYEFNLTTIAAFLTLIGYSVNDTVVVFDRVRENMRKTRTEPLITLMNRSINQTLSRTILTSGTTFLAVGSLFAFGGEVIRGFGFIMTVGVVVGTYSTMYIAGPFALLWEQMFGGRTGGRRKAKAESRRESERRRAAG